MDKVFVQSALRRMALRERELREDLQEVLIEAGDSELVLVGEVTITTEMLKEWNSTLKEMESLLWNV